MCYEKVKKILSDKEDKQVKNFQIVNLIKINKHNIILAYSHSSPVDMFSNNFDNPVYGSVVMANSDTKGLKDIEGAETFANYHVIMQKNVNGVSEVDSEGYLKISKSRLSFTESENDYIYDEIK